MPDSAPDSALVPDAGKVPARARRTVPFVPPPVRTAPILRQPRRCTPTGPTGRHYAAWCAENAVTPVPADPATVGAYLASLADSPAPATIRRRLAAIGKAHRFNDLPWNPGRRAPLQALLRLHGRPVEKAAALLLAMLRQLVATCNRSARGRCDCALLLIGFATALRRPELVALQVELPSAAAVYGCASPGGKPIRRDRGPRSACCEASTQKPAPCWPSRLSRNWLSAAPARWGGGIADAALHPDAARSHSQLSHSSGRVKHRRFRPDEHTRLCVGFITEANSKGVRDEDIMRQTRHRDLCTMRGYVQRAGPVTARPAGIIDL